MSFFKERTEERIAHTEVAVARSGLTADALRYCFLLGMFLEVDAVAEIAELRRDSGTGHAAARA